MATNPMQRKARTSFLLGMVFTLLITGAIIAFLLMQLMNIKKEEKEKLQSMVSVYILNQDLKSGEFLRQDMFEVKNMSLDVVPNNAISGDVDLEPYFLKTSTNELVYGDTTSYYVYNNKDYIIIETDKLGNADLDGKKVKLNNVKEDEFGSFVLKNKDSIKNDELELLYEKEKTRIYKDTESGKYYKYEIDSEGKNRQKVYFDLNDINVIAKTNLKTNTVITSDLFIRSDKAFEDSTRRQEYNMIVLPIDIESGDYVDIRLMLPSGEDYIVLSKKIVEIPYIGETLSEDTIYLELSEDELLSLSSAIIEAYWINGAKLYATRYVEPGIQKAATITYPPKIEIVKLINENPNVLQNAKRQLSERYNSNQRNESLNNAINSSVEQGKSNVETSMQESITTTKEDRKEYLESLNSSTSDSEMTY